MKYKITLKRELWNGLLHIVIGGVFSYVIVPTYSIIVIVSTAFGLGLSREILQKLRKKEQPLIIHIIDVLGFVIGGLLWIAIRESFNINADIL